jgi:hypothetical protein
MEGHIKNHGPMGLVTLAMIFTGSYINTNSNQESISNTWCNTSDESIGQLPKGLEETVLVMSILVPMLPLILNHPNAENIEMIKAHVVGQSSSYGLTEIMRHFTVYPEPSFLKKCNITNQECQSKTLSVNNFTVLSSNSTKSFCKRNYTNENKQELFDSTHHFPNPTCVMLGSSLTSIVCLLFFWHRITKENKTPYQTTSWKQTIIIMTQFSILFVVALYCFYLYRAMDSVQIIGVLLGAIIQFCITFSLLKESK